MNMRNFIVALSLLNLTAVYLFVTAPAPLATTRSTQSIPIENALALLNEENSIMRALYSQRIVGDGKQRKIPFSEDFEDDSIHAGPLPANLLRLTGRYLESQPLPLSLFLGSDAPINKSNKFTDEQKVVFDIVKKTGQPQFQYLPDIARFAYITPDFAQTRACVSCHNKHRESPKTDWHLNDVMGGVTWLYPRDAISVQELMEMITTLREGFKAAYDQFLHEMTSLENPPVVGKKWPAQCQCRCIPNRETFLSEFTRLANQKSFGAMLSLADPKNNVNTTEGK